MADNRELTALKGLLRERKITYRKLALITGMTSQALSRKVNGYSAFDVIELDKIAEYLKIETADIPRYFFSSPEP